MHDQADQLRKLVRDAVARHGDLAPGAPLIAVGGGATGAGVTTLACQLARELARLGKRVALVDANVVAPAVAENFKVTAHGTLGEVLAGERRAIEVLHATSDGIRILAGVKQPAALNAEAFDRFSSELAALCRQSDAVILDAGAEMNPWTDRLWQLAQQVLLTTAPTTDAVLDAYAAVKLAQHDRLAGKLRLAINRCDDPAVATRLHASFADTCQRFLHCPVQAPAVLPTIRAAGDDDPYRRAVRLLAADLACDFRLLVARIPAHRDREVRPLDVNPASRITHSISPLADSR